MVFSWFSFLLQDQNLREKLSRNAISIPNVMALGGKFFERQVQFIVKIKRQQASSRPHNKNQQPPAGNLIPRLLL